MITTELKDQILKDLTDLNSIRVQVFAEEEGDKLNIDMETYIAILDYFARLNLIKLRKFKGGEMLITLTVEAFDLVRYGGFHAQEELLKNNIEKLNLEIQSLSKELSPSFKDRMKEITELSCSILSALTLFK